MKQKKKNGGRGEINTRKNVNKLEKIQRMGMKLVPELEGLQYEERLREINLSTLKQRRERGMEGCVGGH